MSESIKTPAFTRRRFLQIAAGASSLLAADAFAFEPYDVRVRTVNLARQDRVRRFVHFTDLHYKGDHAYAESVVAQINALNPQFVCFTGDLIEDARYQAEALDILQGIKVPLYGTAGNHDYKSRADFGLMARKFASTGGRWLVDQSAALDDGNIHLMGADCGNPNACKPVSGATNIVMMHYPAFADLLNGKRFDLMLAGHSHGGQVRIPFIGSLILPKNVGQYDLGLYKTLAGPLYVNPGIGYFRLNVRFNCPPEITLFEV